MKNSWSELRSAVIVAIICVAIASVAAWWITRGKPAPSFELGDNVIDRSIEIDAEGESLHYQENRIWSENYFPEIMENQNEFEYSLIENFNQTLITYGEYNEHSVNADVEFHEDGNMTVLRCDIEGAKSGDWFTFKWLLRPLGYPEFDFYDFQESGKGLSWEGTIDNVQTDIVISFPFTISHCKAHVWPE